MNYMITRDDLWSQRQKVLNDKTKVEERIKAIDEEREKLSSTLYALSGALQTIDYFMSKTEVEDNNSSSDSVKTEEDELSEPDK